MRKSYFYITLIIILLSLNVAFSQDGKVQSKSFDGTIEGLSLYPNPVNGDKIYITSKSGNDKDIIIFDVLGKKVLVTTLSGKELNIGSLLPGVYIIQIKEEEASATRKLIVK